MADNEFNRYIFQHQSYSSATDVKMLTSRVSDERHAPAITWSPISYRQPHTPCVKKKLPSPSSPAPLPHHRALAIMKVLTLNFLTCAVKACKSSSASFPLHPKDAELVSEDLPPNPKLLANLLPRLDWDALSTINAEVRLSHSTSPPSSLLLSQPTIHQKLTPRSSDSLLSPPRPPLQRTLPRMSNCSRTCTSC
jgi:hypothetical protein